MVQHLVYQPRLDSSGGLEPRRQDSEKQGRRGEEEAEGWRKEREERERSTRDVFRRKEARDKGAVEDV